VRHNYTYDTWDPTISFTSFLETNLDILISNMLLPTSLFESLAELAGLVKQPNFTIPRTPREQFENRMSHDTYLYLRFDIKEFTRLYINDLLIIKTLADREYHIQPPEFSRVTVELSLIHNIENQGSSFSQLRNGKSRRLIHLFVKQKNTNPQDQQLMNTLKMFHICLLLSIDIGPDDFDSTGSFHSPVYNKSIALDDLYCVETMKPYAPALFNISCYVCESTFEYLVSSNNTDTDRPTTNQELTSSGIYTPPAILSLVCTIVSNFCCCMTLFTYLACPDMLTQPGLNNMVLVGHLLVAQCLLQFGASQAENVSKTACSIIGAFVHYSWLLVIMSMNVCTLHMFRVFHNLKSATEAPHTGRTTLKYVAYIYVLSALPVVAVVVTSLILSGNSSLGYGGNVCYISDQRMILYCFTIPLACVVLCNITLFMVVIVKIYSFNSLNRKSTEQRNLLLIYFRMSTITGITWVFAFLYTSLRVSWLEYLFIVFNGLQGLFVFVAFACKKRQFEMIRKRLSFSTKTSSLKSYDNQPGINAKGQHQLDTKL